MICLNPCEDHCHSGWCLFFWCWTVSQIKGPDNPTCHLLPISCKWKMKTGWERQERDRRWWKTDRVREFRVRRLCVRSFIQCIWTKQHLWILWRWWKANSVNKVRMGELWGSVVKSKAIGIWQHPSWQAGEDGKLGVLGYKTSASSNLTISIWKITKFSYAKSSVKICK